MKTSNAVVRSPATLREAVALRAAHPGAMVLAGGTDIMVFLEAGTIAPTELLDLWGCAGLRGVSPNGRRIGAMSTWTDLVRAPGVPEVLKDCARTVGAVQIQNRGTVGGNIMNASPVGDSLPLWLALDAEFELVSVRGTRSVPALWFWTGYRKTALAPDELLVAVHLPEIKDDRLHYRKVGTRLAQAISKVVLGARLRVADGVVTEARIALGSVAPVPMRARAVEAALLGRSIDPAAADLLARDIKPIDDVRSTATYRRTVATNILRAWLLEQAWRAK